MVNNGFLLDKQVFDDDRTYPIVNAERGYTTISALSLSGLLSGFQGSINPDNYTIIGFDKLSNADCMRSYSNTMMVGRRNVLAMTNELGRGSLVNNSVLDVQGHSPIEAMNGDPLSWICAFIPKTGFPCDVNEAIRHASTYKVDGYSIQYCLSEVVPEYCTLQFSLHIMVVVICCNIIKLLCFVLTFRIQEVSCLATIG